jgi:hypothetical protein
MAPSTAARRVAGQRNWPSVLHHKWIETLIPVGVGLACFAITELMHYLLVPDIGRQKERWLAEAVSALVVGVLVGKLGALMRRQHQIVLARVQVISETNHHIRNALMAISASADISQNQECIRIISESVHRIAWVLREILPRKQPLPEAERTRLMFSMSGDLRESRDNDEPDVNLSFGGRKWAG